MAAIVPFTDEHATAVFNLRVATFSSSGPMPFDPEEIYVPSDRRIVALDGDTVVGHAGAWEFGQYFGGQRVPMAGVGAVLVSATHRGRGVGRSLVTQLLEQIRATGEPIATLYPATVTPYRRLGWEHAGTYRWLSIATSALADLPAPPHDITLRAADMNRDIDALVGCHDQQTSTEPGGLSTNQRWARRTLTPEDDESDELVVAERAGQIVGYIHFYREADPGPGHSAYRLVVTALVASDAEVRHALWGLVAGYRSMAATVRFISSPVEPLWFELPEDAIHQVPELHTWMTRLIDAPEAVATRGFPDSLSVRLRLGLRDERIPSNNGDFVLEIADGEGELAPADAGPEADVTLDINAMSAIYTGFADPRLLATSGRITGTPGGLEQLADAFGGHEPFLRSYF